MAYSDGTIQDYLEAIASRKPTPGGGSVAALTGALGAALGQMVGVYTSGKKYTEVEEQARAIVAATAERQAALVRYINEDCTAYDKVSEAMGLPKETDEQKDLRRAAMQEAFVGAMAVPMEICRESLGLLRSLKELVPIGNKNLGSDIGVAALLAAAAFEGAKFNVEINLGSIKDAQVVQTAREEVNGAHKEAIGLRNKIVAQVTAAIGLS